MFDRLSVELNQNRADPFTHLPLEMVEMIMDKLETHDQMYVPFPASHLLSSSFCLLTSSVNAWVCQSLGRLFWSLLPDFGPRLTRQLHGRQA